MGIEVGIEGEDRMCDDVALRSGFDEWNAVEISDVDESTTSCYIQYWFLAGSYRFHRSQAA